LVFLLGMESLSFMFYGGQPI